MPPLNLQQGYNLSDATVFFQSIMSKPWINQLVLAPHIYCPGVTSATICYSGQELFTGLDQSFGYLTVSPGWCSNGTCRVSTYSPFHCLMARIPA